MRVVRGYIANYLGRTTASWLSTKVREKLEATAPRFPAAPSAETPVVAATHVPAPAPNSALRDNGF